MKISLLDPGLQSRTGHHFDWVYQLALEARRRQMEVVIGCNKQVQDDVLAALEPVAKVCPVFSVNPYHEPPPAFASLADRETREAVRHGKEQQALARELQTLPPSNLWLFPTLYASQATACALVEAAPAMAGCIHKSPDLDGAPGARSWQHALNALARRNSPSRIGTTTGPLQQAFAGLTPLPISVWPLAHDGLRSAKPRSRVTTVGILGYQRLEKGLNILPPLVARLLEQGLKVLLHDASGQLHAPALPGLQMVSGFVTDFPALVQQCDLIVVPNNPASYRTSGSGIVWEAMAGGVPVLVPQGCYPGNLVQQHGVGLCFAALTPQAIVSTVRDALVRYPQLAAAAHACSQQWPNQHGVGHFLDHALGQAVAPSVTP